MTWILVFDMLMIGMDTEDVAWDRERLVSWACDIYSKLGIDTINSNVSHDGYQLTWHKIKAGKASTPWFEQLML